MPRYVTSAIVALASAAAAGAAHAEIVNVSLSSPSVSVGNLVITSSPVSLKVTGGGVVSIVGGGVRIKANGVATTLPTQTVTVQCGGVTTCKNAVFKVVITQAAVSGRATSISAINVSNQSFTAGNGSFSAASEAAPGPTPMFTITGGNSNNFTFVFTLGSTVVLGAGAGNTASWSYNVRVAP
jgi:hypothetical protein